MQRSGLFFIVSPKGDGIVSHQIEIVLSTEVIWLYYCSVMIVTQFLLNLMNLVLRKMANLALVAMTEDVAAFHQVVDEEATLHTWTHVAVDHAVVVSYYYNLSASVVHFVVMNIGVSLTECVYCAESHHSDDHHALESCSHCTFVF